MFRPTLCLGTITIMFESMTITCIYLSLHVSYKLDDQESPYS